MGVPLNYISIGKNAKVNSIQGGKSINKKLKEMGLNKGATIKIVSNDVGPLIVKLGESRLVLGRGMVQKIMVDEVSESE